MKIHKALHSRDHIDRHVLRKKGAGGSRGELHGRNNSGIQSILKKKVKERLITEACNSISTEITLSPDTLPVLFTCV